MHAFWKSFSFALFKFLNSGLFLFIPLILLFKLLSVLIFLIGKIPARILDELVLESSHKFTKSLSEYSGCVIKKLDPIFSLFLRFLLIFSIGRSMFYVEPMANPGL